MSSTIATDAQGEHYAFGTTVPYPCPSTPLQDEKQNIEHLVKKLVDNHKEYIRTTVSDSSNHVAALTLTLPVAFHTDYSLADVFNHLVTCTGLVAQALAANGAAVGAMAPVSVGGMDTENNAGSEMAHGVQLSILMREDLEDVSASNGEYENAQMWLERVFSLYSKPILHAYLGSGTATPETATKH